MSVTISPTAGHKYRAHCASCDKGTVTTLRAIAEDWRRGHVCAIGDLRAVRLRRTPRGDGAA